jgi:serine protease Do
MPDLPDNPRVTPVVRAYNKVRPAIVNISSEYVATAGVGPFGQDPFEDIFPMPLRRRVPVQSLGSGFVIHPSGYVVTNAHVVRRAQKITVSLSDDLRLPAKVIAADAQRDLAVLKVEPPAGAVLAHLPLGRSDDLMVGETVIAIGNPLGYANSVTTGVISAVNREMDFGNGIKYVDLIQTDAPINPGNSGGPLLNVMGELIGINTAIRADAQNIGFAIPVDALSAELLRLLDFERINRVIFGATVEVRHARGGDEVVVADVRSGTPAAARLAKGDRIREIEGAPVRQAPDYACRMLAAKAGQLRLTIDRGQGPQDVTLTLDAKPKPDGKALAQKLFGMSLTPLTAESAKDARLMVDRGLAVITVEKGSPADKIGLRPRDVIFQINRLYVSDLDELGEMLEEVRPGGAIRIGVVRGNVAAWVNVTAAGG